MQKAFRQLSSTDQRLRSGFCLVPTSAASLTPIQVPQGLVIYAAGRLHGDCNSSDVDRGSGTNYRCTFSVPALEDPLPP